MYGGCNALAGSPGPVAMSRTVNPSELEPGSASTASFILVQGSVYSHALQSALCVAGDGGMAGNRVVTNTARDDTNHLGAYGFLTAVCRPWT